MKWGSGSFNSLNFKPFEHLQHICTLHVYINTLHATFVYNFHILSSDLLTLTFPKLISQITTEKINMWLVWMTPAFAGKEIIKKKDSYVN